MRKSIVSGSHRNVLSRIGKTTLLALRKVVPANGSRILLKLENENPTGANVIAASRLAEQLGPDATILTILCDTGLKYLSTDLFRAQTSSHGANAG